MWQLNSEAQYGMALTYSNRLKCHNIAAFHWCDVHFGTSNNVSDATSILWVTLMHNPLLSGVLLLHKKLKIQGCENKQKKKRCLDIKTKVVVHLGIIFQKTTPDGSWVLHGFPPHYAKVQKYEQGKIGLQFLDIWC